LGRAAALAVAAIALSGLAVISAAGSAAAQSAEDDRMIVTLLGTGTPGLYPDRFSSANLVEAGGLKLLIDAGRGATLRIGQLGYSLGQIDATFLTHMHSDHVSGLADMFMTSYIRVPYIGGRTEPFQLYGPTGTQKLADGLVMAHGWDIETRIEDEGVPLAATTIQAHEAEEGVVFDQNGVTVTTFPVNHGDKIENAVGYRVDYKGKSVLFSGDTTYEPNVVTYAKGVKLLIHEVGMATEKMMQHPSTATVLAHHTSPEDVGRIFSQAAPDYAVYSHMVLMGDPPIQELISRTRSTYDGPLVIGEDLMQFVLEDGGVTVLNALR